jgi:Icc-related predicted phosphoesterase
MSDLHTEFESFSVPASLPDADVCIVAGDFGVGGIVPALEWLHAQIAARMEVVFVAGNHDFYNVAWVEALSDGRRAAARMERVHFLENDIVEISGVTFIGCTLWTDYALAGHRQLSMFEASNAMNDYKRIIYSKRPFAKFNPLRALRIHQESTRYLDRALETADGETVVVTHHAPSERSVPDRYRQHRLRPAYASDLEDLILRHRPSAWIHGHIHEPVDYMIGETRVVSDPRGYPTERGGRFGQLVIDV